MINLANQKLKKDRSPRFESENSKSLAYVYCSGPSLGTETRGAYLIDISETGMYLVSRAPMRLNKGDFIFVEFTLEGSDKKIKKQAQVMRRVNEYSFAVRFLGAEINTIEDLKLALQDHLKSRKKSKIWVGVQKFGSWAKEHQQGLLASLLGLVILGGAVTYIFLNSDEHQGKGMRSWGNKMPQGYYWDYVKRFHK